MQVLQKNSYTRLKPEICNSGYQKLSQHQQLQKKEIEGVGKAPQDPLYIFKAFLYWPKSNKAKRPVLAFYLQNLKQLSKRRPGNAGIDLAGVVDVS